ncbi:hypothetical protein [Sphingomonas sp.]|uniref:hypothetical protein n=1 Tax=Sphingomonas sp. TaxID=28214 RepID=UPI001D682C21|nr:hypothetical protein [Sphingomonas sp.]MBX9796245.1 hypothetical protein [Sphingomonas sp.]
MSGFWRNWLSLWCVGVIVFGVVLLLGGLSATSALTVALLDQLNGDAPLEVTPPLYFANGVLGGVSIGWGVATLGAVRVAADLGAQGTRLWRWLTAGVLSWFVTDSTLSVATGFGLNVVPNMVLLITFFVPLFATGVLSGRPAK